MTNVWLLLATSPQGLGIASESEPRLVPGGPVEDAGPNTNVIQTIRFKFPGDFWWVNFPWHGGMRPSPEDIARWEQKAVYQRKISYRATAPADYGNKENPNEN